MEVFVIKYTVIDGSDRFDYTEMFYNEVDFKKRLSIIKDMYITDLKVYSGDIPRIE